MTKTEMLTAYAAASAADSYLIGFTFKGTLYSVELPEIPENIVRLTRTSSRRGGVQQLRLYIPAAVKAAWALTAKALGDAAKLLAPVAKLNRGERFERLIRGESWQKDSVPFWVAGDIEIAGRQVQIKLDGAEIGNEKALRAAGALA